MEIEHVTDEGGHTLDLQVVDGSYYPTFPTDVIRDMTSLKIRPDDIIVTGYLKAGTHWVWEMVRMALQGSTQLEVMEKDTAMMELSPQAAIDALPGRRVLNTHVLFHQLPTQVMEAKPKILYLTRNPKDTAVSLYHHHTRLWDYYHYDGAFSDYLPLFLAGKVDYGSWFDHIKSWSDAATKCQYEDHIPFLEVNYEDLSEDPARILKEIASFIDVDLPSQLLSDIVHHCTLERMRQRKGHFDVDRHGQPVMYRKGKVGVWREYFTVAQSEHFDQVYHQTMAKIDTRFHWRFTLDQAN